MNIETRLTNFRLKVIMHSTEKMYFIEIDQTNAFSPEGINHNVFDDGSEELDSSFPRIVTSTPGTSRN